MLPLATLLAVATPPGAEAPLLPPAPPMSPPPAVFPAVTYFVSLGVWWDQVTEQASEPSAVAVNMLAGLADVLGGPGEKAAGLVAIVGVEDRSAADEASRVMKTRFGSRMTLKIKARVWERKWWG